MPSIYTPQFKEGKREEREGKDLERRKGRKKKGREEGKETLKKNMKKRREGWIKSLVSCGTEECSHIPSTHVAFRITERTPK